MKIPSATEFYTPRNHSEKDHHSQRSSSRFATPDLQQATEAVTQAEPESEPTTFSDILAGITGLIILGGIFWFAGFWIGLAVIVACCVFSKN